MNTRTNSAHRPQITRSSIRTAMKKIICLGTSTASSQKRAMVLCCFAVGPLVAWMLMGMAVRECNDSIVMELANRSSIEESVQCLIFIKGCRCRISPNETLFFDSCLPHLQLFAMRIIPVISCVLELLAFLELITFGTDGNRFSNPVAWVMFTLVSIGIAIAISIVMFSTHCHHLFLGLATFATSALLTMLVFHEFEENRRVSENEHRRTNTNQSARSDQPIDNDPKSWRGIISSFYLGTKVLSCSN